MTDFQKPVHLKLEKIEILLLITALKTEQAKLGEKPRGYVETMIANKHLIDKLRGFLK